MSASEDSIDKQRRDVYAVSLAIILFNAAGGAFSGGVGTPIGAITFASDALVLETAAWLAWAYFFWRFRLAAGDVLGGIPAELRLAAMQSPFYRQIARTELARAHSRLRLISEDAKASANIRNAADALLRNNFDVISENWIPLPVKGSWLSRMLFSRMVHAKELDSGSSVTEAEHFSAQAVELLGPVAPRAWSPPALYWLRYSAESVAIMVLARSYFGDRVLPYLVACIAPVTAWIHHGR